MISLNQPWPWQRFDAPRRNLVIVALLLISASGFVSGLALRPVVQNWSPTSVEQPAAHAVTNPTTSTQSHVAVAAAPERFGATMLIAPHAVNPGATFTITAQTNTSANSAPASGVVCQITLANFTGTALSSHVTDGQGITTWTITVPPGTTKGVHVVTLHASWGFFAATYQLNVVVA